jgi:hypothetical protein
VLPQPPPSPPATPVEFLLKDFVDYLRSEHPRWLSGVPETSCCPGRTSGRWQLPALARGWWSTRTPGTLSLNNSLRKSAPEST